MLEAPPNQLNALTTALEAAGIALALARRVPAPLRSLADQVVRSATSVAANLSEGHGRSGRDRLHHWHIAYASAKHLTTPRREAVEMSVSVVIRRDAASRRSRALRRRRCGPRSAAMACRSAAAAALWRYVRVVEVDTHLRLLVGAGAVEVGRARVGPRPVRPGACHDLAAAASEGVSGLPRAVVATTLHLPLSLSADAAPDPVAVPAAVAAAVTADAAIQAASSVVDRSKDPHRNGLGVSPALTSTPASPRIRRCLELPP